MEPLEQAGRVEQSNFLAIAFPVTGAGKEQQLFDADNLFVVLQLPRQVLEKGGYIAHITRGIETRESRGGRSKGTHIQRDRHRLTLET
jgi:hypothetical protein